MAETEIRISKNLHKTKVPGDKTNDGRKLKDIN